IVEELCGKSVSKSFVSSLTEQLEPMVNEWQNRLLSEKNYPYLKHSEEKLEYFNELKDALNQSIIVAQDTADKVKTSASKESEVI
ncbi:transposase, partial [Enterococcus faecium]|uniref:transposase n=1 Tax=Enterococcus faecium TaxID=1352 RepID=UPI002930DD77